MMITPLHLIEFLRVPTPDQWCKYASSHIDVLLIDHAHCERKAAATALQIIAKNPHHSALIKALSPIVREEMLHFEKVLRYLKKYQIRLQPLPPCNYGKSLHKLRSKRSNEESLRDDLVIGAMIEARSCERFFALLPYLEQQHSELFQFYSHLAQAEQRHFEIYLKFASEINTPMKLEQRLAEFMDIENNLIQQEDTCFRFHSGPPI
jgi:tRNA-(ms[2]io[6]A)-hydroxylase